MSQLFGKLRKKPMPQRSDMTPEEQLANPEEGAQEQGYMETAEDALTQGKDQLGDTNSGAIGIGKIEGTAEKALASVAKKPKMFSLDQIRKFVSPDKLEKISNEVRVQGYSHLTHPETGEIIGTVGQHSGLGKELAKESQAVTRGAMDTGHSIDYSKNMEMNAPKSGLPLRERGPKGEAADFMERTGVDPTRKNAVATMQELRQKEAEKQAGLMSRLRANGMPGAE